MTSTALDGGRTCARRSRARWPLDRRGRHAVLDGAVSLTWREADAAVRAGGGRPAALGLARAAPRR